MRRSRHTAVAVVALCLVAGIAAAFWFHGATVPRIDGFDPSGHSWRAFGGAWDLDGSVMRNRSDERGAKLVTGSALWGDYSVETDVALLGSFGDAGVLLRANDIGQGVDSYRGYFVGLRDQDDALVVGRSDYGWEEYRSIVLPGGVKTGQPYHLRLVAVGCAIGIAVNSPGGAVVRTGVEVTDCWRTGKPGLQSYQTPASWSHFKVAPATQADLQAVLAGTPLGSEREGTLHVVVPEANRHDSMLRDARLRRPNAPVTPIAELRLLAAGAEQTATIRGVVRLLSPMLYVEDSTGGLEVELPGQTAVAVGEEIEVAGTMMQQRGHPVLRGSVVKELSSNSAMPSLIAGAFEAATGAVDSRLVTLEGTLLRHWNPSPQQLVLELESSGEVFRAILEKQTYGEALPSLEAHSQLQLTGIVTSDPLYVGDSAFAVLVSSNQGAVRVTTAAPWWTPAHITALAICLSLLIVGFMLLSHRLKERTLLQILDERELLAHDLHDTVSQSFAGIGYQLGAMEDNLPAPEKARLQLKRAQAMVRESHQELRRSITTLRTDVNNLNDLAEGLKRCAMQMIGGGALELVWECDELSQRVPLRIADCFFRVGQEAISNAVSHAHASRLAVRLHLERRRLVMEIEDNGCGLSAQRDGGGNGLFGMSRRAEIINARFEVRSDRSGTVVSLESELPRVRSLFNLSRHASDESARPS